MDPVLDPAASLDPAAPAMPPCALRAGAASLSRGLFFKEASLDMTLSLLTESAAQMADVSHVSIWALTDGQDELRCLERYDRVAGRHSCGEARLASHYPEYFRQLEGECCIDAAAVEHPLTREFSRAYLSQHGLASVLSTPIHIRGELQGVLCLEQRQRVEAWTPAQRLFAQAVANLVTLALVEFEAEQARHQARLANDRLQAVFDGALDAMVLFDGGSGLVLDANRQAELLFGCARRQLIGRHHRSLHPEGQVAEASARCFRELVSGRVPVRVVSGIRCADGVARSVEINGRVSDLADGRRLVMAVFRPV